MSPENSIIDTPSGTSAPSELSLGLIGKNKDQGDQFGVGKRVYSVFGLTCSNCARGLENHFQTMGFSDVSVRYPDCTLELSSQSPLSDAEVLKFVSSQGYQALPYQFSHKGKDFRRLLWFLIISALCTAPMLIGMLVHIPYSHDPLVQLALTLPPFFIAMFVFGRSALHSLARRAPNMDVLITMGVGTSFAYSLIGLLFSLGPEYLFFETAASITTFVLLGNVLERRAVLGTRSALDELHELTPQKAQKRMQNGSFESVATRELVQGDILRLVSGDRVPADVMIQSGTGLIDESHLTGESRPVERTRGEELFAGSTIAQGNFDARVLAAGEKTVIAEIVRSVEEALNSQPPIQRSADRVAAVFVPIVLVIAALTFGINWLVLGSITESVLRAIAVLVIACPCAVGLATPTAVMVGLGRMAKFGILCRSGASLERFARTEHVVFDKTGTLTLPQLKIVKTHTFNEGVFSRLATTLASIPDFSRHPYSQALTTLASPPNSNSDVPPSILEVREHRGIGLECLLSDGSKLQLGSDRIITSEERLRAAQSYDLYVVYNGSWIAAFDIDENVRPEVPDLLRQLDELGIAYSLLSGDRPERVSKFAKQLGIREARGGVTPVEKMQHVQSLSESQVTTFIGDGINDGPALSSASVGASIGGGSQVSLSSATLLFLSGGLSRFREGLALARATLRTIHENLFWAFFYNVCAIPVAALGFLSPMIAAFAMAFSDIIVIGNSMRLRRRSLNKFMK